MQQDFQVNQVVRTHVESFLPEKYSTSKAILMLNVGEAIKA